MNQTVGGEASKQKLQLVESGAVLEAKKRYRSLVMGDSHPVDAARMAITATWPRGLVDRDARSFAARLLLAARRTARRIERAH